MNKYTGLISEVSDLSYQNQVDVDAYVAIARKYQGRILELGSGSGHISVGLAKEGYEVTGIEIRRDMIQLHKDKLDDSTRTRTEIILGDMCGFELGEKFDLIIAPNNVIAYLDQVVDFMAMLQSVKDHLSDKGVFVIEAIKHDPHKLLRANDIERTNIYQIPSTGKHVEERVKPHYNPDSHMISTSKVITEYEGQAIKRRVEYISEEKVWLEEALDRMIDQVGLSVVLKSGDIKSIEPIDQDSLFMVYYISK